MHFIVYFSRVKYSLIYVGTFPIPIDVLVMHLENEVPEAVAFDENHLITKFGIKQFQTDLPCRDFEADNFLCFKIFLLRERHTLCCLIMIIGV